MPKQQVTIEVDVPEGYEARARYCGSATMEDGRLIDARYAVDFVPAWQWPSWLTVPFIAHDEYGKWHGYRFEPTEALATWNFDYRWNLNGLIDTSLLPPLSTDWRQSKRRRPT